MVAIYPARNTKRASLFLALIFVAGCAPIMVPVGDSYPSQTPSPSTAPQPAPEHKAEPPVRQIEPTQTETTAASSAVMQLLTEGWRLHDNGEYDRANAVAERALRLDRSEPEIYLLMASSYFSMWQLTLAEQLARQGIPLASNDRSTESRLRTLLDQILSAQ